MPVRGPCCHGDYIDILPTAQAGGLPPSRVSFPVSPRLARIGFHRPWSYSLSAGFKYRQPDGMYVPSSVDITIMMNATFRARPLTDIKRQGVEHMPTFEAAFRRRVPLVDFDKVASVPLGFVVQLGHKLTPAHITDGFTQRMVLDHVLHRKVLDTDRLVFTNQTCRELVREITAAVSDASNFLAGFGTVLRPLFLLGMPSLSLGQFLFILTEEFGVANVFSIREDHEGLQAQVCTDRGISLRQMWNILFYQDGDEVAISTVFGNGDTPRLCPFGQGTRPHDIERPVHLGERQVLPIPLKGSANVGSRLLVASLLELGVLATSLEEIDECFIKMAQDLLQWNRGDFTKPLIALFQCRKHSTQVFIVEALLLVVERIRLLAQGPIVDEAATPECTSQHLLLLVRGADAVLVGFSLVHVLHHNTHDVECQADNSACGRWCFTP